LGQLQNIFIALVNNFNFAPAEHSMVIKQLFFYITPLVLIEFVQYYRDDTCPVRTLPVFARGVLYTLIFYYVVIFGATDAQDFIYLQF
jgi:hypothetical protein